MKNAEFLNDATGATEGWSERQKHHRLAQLLAAAGEPTTPRSVEKWFVRENIPSKWIFAIVRAAAKDGRVLDINTYA